MGYKMHGDTENFLNEADVVHSGICGSLCCTCIFQNSINYILGSISQYKLNMDSIGLLLLQEYFVALY